MGAGTQPVAHATTWVLPGPGSKEAGQPSEEHIYVTAWILPPVTSTAESGIQSSMPPSRNIMQPSAVYAAATTAGSAFA